MQTNGEGVALIQRYEGLELKAYPDPGTGSEPWTIGYGHTSAAGLPKVKPGMRITKAEATEILKRDLAVFEAGVNSAVKVDLTPNQFSALVSFAYNVGLGNFRKSSVLAAVNAGRHDDVPRRLGFWVKAAGRTLPGLVRRRSAEGRLYAGSPSLLLDDVLHVAEIDDMRRSKGEIEGGEDDALYGKSLFGHRRIWAAIAGWLGGGASSFIGVLTGFDWRALIVIGAFVSVWLIVFAILYRKEIADGAFRP